MGQKWTEEEMLARSGEVRLSRRNPTLVEERGRKQARNSREEVSGCLGEESRSFSREGYSPPLFC